MSALPCQVNHPAQCATNRDTCEPAAIRLTNKFPISRLTKNLSGQITVAGHERSKQVSPAIGLQSMLFVPGTRPERFAKALASGADCVCIDLEDAVPAGDKATARAAALDSLGDPRVAIRINGLTTADGLADLLALVANPIRPRLVFIPKVESPHEIVIARSVLADATVGFVPLIETARGLRAADAIAAEPGAAMMMFGGGDFSAELGVALAWEPLLYARSRFAMACAGAGIPSMDVPYIRLGDQDGLITETRRAKELGFAAKAAIHPDQIAGIHHVMRPTVEDLAEAREAEVAFAAASGGAVRFRGKLLEAPMMRRFRQIIAIGEQANA